jgi:hypothetical protein
MRATLKIVGRCLLVCLMLATMYFAAVGLLGWPLDLRMNIPLRPNMEVSIEGVLLVLPYAIVGIVALFGYFRAASLWQRRSWAATITVLALMASVEFLELMRLRFPVSLRALSTVLGYLLALFVLSALLLRALAMAKSRDRVDQTQPK